MHFDRLLAEPFIRGRELTVAVLGDEALCVTELKPKAGFYDFDAKYTDGMTEHVCPAEVPPAIAEAMMAMALRAHQLLGCKGASRSDFRWDDELGEAGIYLLEINTQPGMTPLSLVPEQARQKGIAYGELVERIIAEALGAQAATDGRGARQARGRRADRDAASPRRASPCRRSSPRNSPVEQAAGQSPRDLGVRAVRAGDRRWSR